MASARSVAGAALLLIGILALAVGAYYLLLYEEVFFSAENATVLPGEKDAVLVTSGSKIVIESYGTPMYCRGSKLLLTDNLGRVVWESEHVAAVNVREVVEASSCKSPMCFFYMTLWVPPTCTGRGEDLKGTYTLYVVYKPENVAKAAYAMTAFGLLSLVGGLVLVKSSSRRYVSVEDALLELARRPALPQTLGEPGKTIEVALKSKGVKDRDVSKLLDIVEEKAGVTIEARRPRLSSEYTLVVKGAKENVDEALKSIVWFCQATGKCEVSLKKL